MLDVAVPRLLAWNGSAAVVRHVGFGLRCVSLSEETVVRNIKGRTEVTTVCIDGEVDRIKKGAYYV